MRRKSMAFVVGILVAAIVVAACGERPPPSSDNGLLTEQNAIERAVEQLKRPAPEVTGVENPRNPVAWRMTLGEYYRRSGVSGFSEGADTPVWVVQIEGESSSAGIVPPESRKTYRYAVAVLDARTGNVIAGRRSNEPLAWPTATGVPAKSDPDRMVRETPEPTVTRAPERTPSFPFAPTPTPMSLAGLKTVEYDPSYRASDLSDGRFVSIGPDGEIYLVNLETGEREQLTSDGYRKKEAVLSGEYVAWIDHRRQIEIYDSAAIPPKGFADDIFLFNLATKRFKRITEVPARRSSLRMSGHRLVWVDNRNEIHEHYTHADIYSYDVATGEERPVAVAEGSQQNPSIYDDLVVWADNRNSPALGTVKAGCGNCPENRFDIYLYDFSTGKGEALIESEFLKQQPSIYKNHVVWQDFRNGRESDVYLLDLSTGEERRLTAGGGAHGSPMIAGNHVIWLVRSACDVFPQAPNTGVFAYSLSDGKVMQLSNYVEPSAMVHDDIVLITEECFFPRRIYSVFLQG